MSRSSEWDVASRKARGGKYVSVLGTSYLVLGTWYFVLGTSYLVLGTWYLVFGTWYLRFAQNLGYAGSPCGGRIKWSILAVSGNLACRLLINFPYYPIPTVPQKYIRQYMCCSFTICLCFLKIRKTHSKDTQKILRRTQDYFKSICLVFFTPNRGAASGRPPKGAAAFGRRPLWVLYLV